MSSDAFKDLIARAAADPAFAERLRLDPDNALAGEALTEEERDQLLALETDAAPSAKPLGKRLMKSLFSTSIFQGDAESGSSSDPSSGGDGGGGGGGGVGTLEYAPNTQMSPDEVTQVGGSPGEGQTFDAPANEAPAPVEAPPQPDPPAAPVVEAAPQPDPTPAPMPQAAPPDASTQPGVSLYDPGFPSFSLPTSPNTPVTHDAPVETPGQTQPDAQNDPQTNVTTTQTDPQTQSQTDPQTQSQTDPQTQNVPAPPSDLGTQIVQPAPDPSNTQTQANAVPADQPPPYNPPFGTDPFSNLFNVPGLVTTPDQPSPLQPAPADQPAPPPEVTAPPPDTPPPPPPPPADVAPPPPATEVAPPPPPPAPPPADATTQQGAPPGEGDTKPAETPAPPQATSGTSPNGQGQAPATSETKPPDNQTAPADQKTPVDQKAADDQKTADDQQKAATSPTGALTGDSPAAPPPPAPIGPVGGDATSPPPAAPAPPAAAAPAVAAAAAQAQPGAGQTAPTEGTGPAPGSPADLFRRAREGDPVAQAALAQIKARLDSGEMTSSTLGEMFNLNWKNEWLKTGEALDNAIAKQATELAKTATDTYQGGVSLATGQDWDQIKGTAKQAASDVVDKFGAAQDKIADKMIQAKEGAAQAGQLFAGMTAQEAQAHLSAAVDSGVEYAKGLWKSFWRTDPEKAREVAANITVEAEKQVVIAAVGEAALGKLVEGAGALKTAGTAEHVVEAGEALKDVKTAEHIVTEVKTAENVVADVKTAENVVKDVKTAENVVKDVKTSENVVTDAKTADTVVSDSKTADAAAREARAGESTIADQKPKEYGATPDGGSKPQELGGPDHKTMPPDSRPLPPQNQDAIAKEVRFRDYEKMEAKGMTKEELEHYEAQKARDIQDLATKDQKYWDQMDPQTKELLEKYRTPPPGEAPPGIHEGPTERMAPGDRPTPPAEPPTPPAEAPAPPAQASQPGTGGRPIDERHVDRFDPARVKEGLTPEDLKPYKDIPPANAPHEGPPSEAPTRSYTPEEAKPTPAETPTKPYPYEDTAPTERTPLTEKHPTTEFPPEKQTGQLSPSETPTKAFPAEETAPTRPMGPAETPTKPYSPAETAPTERVDPMRTAPTERIPQPTEKYPPTEFPPEKQTGQFPEPGSFEDHGLKPPPPNEPLQPIERPSAPRVYETPETPFDEPFSRGPAEVHGPPPPPEPSIPPATERLQPTEFPPERPTGRFDEPGQPAPSGGGGPSEPPLSGPRGVASTEPSPTQTAGLESERPIVHDTGAIPSGGTATTGDGQLRPQTTTGDSSVASNRPAPLETAKPAEVQEPALAGAPKTSGDAFAHAEGGAGTHGGGAASSPEPPSTGGKGGTATSGESSATSSAGGAPAQPVPEPRVPFTDPQTGVTITHSIDGAETTVHFEVGDGIARGGMEEFIDTVPNMHRAHAAPPNLGVEDPAGLAPSPIRANLSTDPRIDNYVRGLHEARPEGTTLRAEVTIRRDPDTGQLVSKTYRLEYTPTGQPPGTGTHLGTFGYEIRADGKAWPIVHDAGALGSGAAEDLLGR